MNSTLNAKLVKAKTLAISVAVDQHVANEEVKNPEQSNESVLKNYVLDILDSTANQLSVFDWLQILLVVGSAMDSASFSKSFNCSDEKLAALSANSELMNDFNSSKDIGELIRIASKT